MKLRRFSGERPPEAGFFESVTRNAGEHGFTLIRRKIRLQKSTSRQTVTGIVANQKPNVNRGYKRKLRAQLHALDLPGPYSAICKHFRIQEAPTHLVCQYLLAFEGRLFYKTYSFPISSYSLTKSQTVENDSISQTTSAELQRQFEGQSEEWLSGY